MKYLIIIVFIFCWIVRSHGQVQGRIFTKAVMSSEEGGSSRKAEENLPGVNVYWLGTTVGSTTDIQGKFNLPEPDHYPAKMVISYVGYQSDTLNVSSTSQRIDVELMSTVTMKEAVITERKETTSLSLMSGINIENIGEGELTRAACCNISEAFETNASIDVVASDGVTGAKKIQMLGLDGIYTSIQAENIPFVRGLGNFDGLAHIPGTWVESIQISKGTGSVLNGYEPMTGQINLELLKPDDLNEKIFVNLYGNAMGRLEANVHVGDKINEKWSTLLLAHANTNQQKNDNNNDGFLDLPLKKQVNVLNRWKYSGPKYMAQFGFHALAEDKLGGQVDFDKEKDYATTNKYGSGAESRHVKVFFKNGFMFDKHPWRSIALIARGSYFEQSFFAGLHEYEGVESYGYGNFIFSDIINNSDHKYKIGASYVFDEYDETFDSTRYTRSESVPGMYGEYTYSSDKFGAVLGLRSDFHNLYGTQVSPKINLKYKYHNRGVFRLSGGRGFRVANIFAENSSTFVSQRVVTIQNNIQPEVAWNTGVSITQKFQLSERDVTLHAEYYYTNFENQLIVDRETPGLLEFHNLNGSSYSNAIQVEVGYEPWKVIQLKMAGKYLDVQSTYNTGLKQAPLIPSWRGLFSIGYQTLNKKWQADLTTQFVGISRIPSTVGNKPENLRAETSDPYVLINTQVTRRFRWWEVYVGSENLGNFIQNNAIISADKPFDSEFDASMIWAPVMGRNVYMGLRFKFF